MQYTIFWLIWIFFRKPVFTLIARMTIFLHNYHKTYRHTHTHQIKRLHGTVMIALQLLFLLISKFEEKWKSFSWRKKNKRKTIDALDHVECKLKRGIWHTIFVIYSCTFFVFINMTCYFLLQNDNYLYIFIYSRVIYLDWHITLRFVSKEISRLFWNVYDNDDMCLVMWFVCFSTLRIVQWNPFYF